MKRAIVIVLDGCGAGAAPDAAAFGDDARSSTLRHVWEASGGFSAPTLAGVGFLSAGGIERMGQSAEARWGRLMPQSLGGKDSVTGHWEMMGVTLDAPFPTYPDGFPAALIADFEAESGLSVLGNRAASGTQIIAELGEEHVRTGRPIVYTSADSVFQIATHEGIVPLPRLYELCEVARRVCQAPNNVQRVIARPFVGSRQEGFTRTQNRRDYPMPPPRNLVDEVGDVLGIGVVPELFGGRGFRSTPRTQSNAEHTGALREALRSDARFIFANFEDFDMLFGHRNDSLGFARCLTEFDGVLAETLAAMTADDLLILTADHGNDPTTESTDHSREYVPVSVVGGKAAPKALGDVPGFNAVGATVAAHLGITWERGVSLLA